MLLILTNIYLLLLLDNISLNEFSESVSFLFLLFFIPAIIWKLLSNASLLSLFPEKTLSHNIISVGDNISPIILALALKSSMSDPEEVPHGLHLLTYIILVFGKVQTY